MRMFCYFFALLLIFYITPTYALTPEEILLLKKAGVPDEKILEMQKKDGGVLPQPVTPINAFDWNNDGKKDILVGARSGEVSVFINMGMNQLPLFGAEMKLNGGDLDVGSSSSPAIFYFF